MSNYTGGARNKYRHRRVAPVSGSRRTAFTSKGLAASTCIETFNVPKRPIFNFRHANNPSERVTSTEPASQIGRIDAVSPKSIQDTPQPMQQRESLNLSSYDATIRNKKLSECDLIGLPKRIEKAAPPPAKMHMEKLSTSGPGHSPSIHHLPEEQESLNDCSMWDEDAMHQEWISHTDGNLESSLRFGSGYSSPGSIDDEILSFPSSPLGVSSRQSTVFRQDSLPPIDGRLGGYGSDRDDITSFSSEMTDNSTSYCRSRIEASPSLFMPSDNLSWDSWDTQDRLDMLRLPGDRSGLGKPLTRWIGDGKGDELAYFVSNDHLRCSADEDAQTDNASNWILQPYETSIERVSEVQKGRRFGEIPEDNALPLERIITPDIDVPISEADPPPNIVRQTPQPDELCSEEWSLDAVYERLFSAQEQSPEEQTQFILGPSLF